MARVPFPSGGIPDGPFPHPPGEAGDGLADGLGGAGWADVNEAEDAIAREVAAGILLPDVARGHRCSTQHLRSLLERPHVAARVAHYREILNLRAQQLVAKTWLAATESLDEIIAIAKSRQHRRHYEANVYLLERVWPQTARTEATVVHQMDANVVMRLLDGIEAIKAGNGGTGDAGYQVEDDPHLRDGKDVDYGLPLASPGPAQAPGAGDDR